MGWRQAQFQDIPLHLSHWLIFKMLNIATISHSDLASVPTTELCWVAYKLCPFYCALWCSIDWLWFVPCHSYLDVWILCQWLASIPKAHGYKLVTLPRNPSVMLFSWLNLLWYFSISKAASDMASISTKLHVEEQPKLEEGYLWWELSFTTGQLSFQ
jgi:hypothetical protein